MDAATRESESGFVDISPWERARLVRLCAHLTGDPDAAEDLAQETLLEAWRSRGKLRDPARRGGWLAGIAQNVCQRWRRREARESSRLAQPPDREDVSDLDAWLPSAVDLEVDLERSELARLLDRAMALLPRDTRAALIGSYIEDLPQAEVAARLGLWQGALRVRLHRGKLALQRILSTDLKAEAMSYALIAADDAWQDTGMWCFACGRHRLPGRFDRGADTMTL